VVTTAAAAPIKPRPLPKTRQRVLWALQQGWSDPRAIAIYTTLDMNRVHAELRRLADKGYVKQVNRNCWKLPQDSCLLAEVWK
jgi:predicted transcriptional regulator